MRRKLHFLDGGCWLLFLQDFPQFYVSLDNRSTGNPSLVPNIPPGGDVTTVVVCSPLFVKTHNLVAKAVNLIAAEQETLNVDMYVLKNIS